MKTPKFPAVDFQATLRDFQNLNPKDVGAWPLAPRIAVLLGGFVVILIAGWWFWWSEQLDMLESKRQG
ncbi:MAG TPA: pilus assembly protein PilO, partial [Accumulibacter sp.]|nr:pilus assembly protein PilO [Accumulibacter sp.]